MMVLTILRDQSIMKLKNFFDALRVKNAHCDYLLLPSNGLHKNRVVIDWKSVGSVLFRFENTANCSLTNDNHQKVHTKNGLICSCLVENALVCTPHNGRLYCTTKRFVDLNGKSAMQTREGGVITYTDYYKKRYYF